MKYLFSICFAVLFFGCSNPKNNTAPDPAQLSWDEILSAAKGSTVNLTMWQGDPYINKYMQDYVVPQVKEKYDIDLKIAAGQGNDIVKLIMSENEAGKKDNGGAFDMAWINGETFFQLRQVSGLYGPFTDKLPNAQLVDFNNPFIGIDFQQKINGYEAPWGNVQFTMIYDSAHVQHPPMNRDELKEYVQQNPGKFTWPYDFTGLTLLKSWLIDMAGGNDSLQGDFNEQKYDKYSAQLWDYVNSIKPYLWKQGKTFPSAVAQMHQLFSNGEIYFTMSNNDGEVDNKIDQGLFPPTSRAYVFSGGTIQNSHYMGILKNANNKAGAMVVINFLMSPEAQYEKLKPDVWGDGTILDLQKLPVEWQKKFAHVPQRKYAPLRSEIQPFALREIAPEYMIRLNDDFRTQVIEK